MNGMKKKKPEIHKEITILLAPETPDERGQKPPSLLKRISGKLATYAEFKKHADALRAVDPSLEGPVVEGPSGGIFWKLAAGFAGVVVALGAGWYFWKEKE
jgi:hypothetical protein